MSSMMCGMLLGAGVVSKKTYVDDVFSTFLYKGTNGANTVNTGLDMSGEGGLLWVKARSNRSHQLFDTVRGVNKRINTDTNSAEDNDSNINQTFTSTGFTFNNTYTDLNDNNVNYSSWNFRKAPGFFDIVTYTGNGTQQRNISHSLGCEPGLILIKRTDSTGNWWVYHRDLGDTDSNYSKAIKLNDNGAKFDDYKIGNRSKNTSTTFMVGNDPQVNGDGGTYVAYVFAGGESTNALARSVGFSSSGSSDGDSLTIASSSDTDLGSGDFTLECWFKDDAGDSSHDTIFALENYGSGGSDSGPGNSFSCYAYNLGIKIFDRSSGSFSTKTDVNNTFGKGQWTHFAWTRSGSGSNNNTIWINGNNVAQFTGTLSYTDGQDFFIGSNDYSRTGTPNEYGFNGNISNVRITKGQAVYTSAFKPSTTPMTTTTGGATASNVKVICCNNSSITGSSVTSGTITSTNTPTASTDSPFDDPAGFVFGEAGDQNVIKCGSFTGTGSAYTPVHLGFEPQWLMVKNATSSDGGGENWFLVDCMRGWPVPTSASANVMKKLVPNENAAENNQDWADPMSDGFMCRSGNDSINGSGDTMIYIAIRRPDGYVGKPPELGTDVFAMDTGNASTTIPVFDSGFPVDFAMNRAPASSTSWYTSARIMQDQYLLTNDSQVANQDGGAFFDSNLGWAKDAYNTWNSDYQSWMWKRGHGMDVVSYDGDSVAGREIPHSLNSVPEMMWVKRRGTSGDNWWVYHKGMNNGNSPEDYYIALNDPYTGTNTSYAWNDTAPTATRFTLGNNTAVNYSGNTYINFLFSSVTGISKVGYHQCDAGNTTLTMGFQPRFLILKNISTSSTPWVVIDSLRGINPGVGVNTPTINLNSNGAQSNYTWVNSISSTGLVITAGQGERFSNDGDVFIWYAHA